MIRSSGATISDWKPVPKGFKVDWKNVDLAVFAHRSRIVAQFEAARQTVIGVASFARFGCGAGYMLVSDRGRRAWHKIAHGSMWSRRSTRIPQVKPLKRRWDLLVRVTVRRELGSGMDLFSIQR
jgi:hypothetical protein